MRRNKDPATQLLVQATQLTRQKDEEKKEKQKDEEKKEKQKKKKDTPGATAAKA